MARIVIDANVLIALCDFGDVHHSWARSMFVEQVDAELSISALTWAECLVRPTASGTVTEMVRQLAGLGLDVEELTELDAVQLAAVRAMHGLRMPDAVVLHTALRRRAAVATTGQALARAALAAGLRVLQP